MEKADAKRLTAKFDDGSTFSYRLTKKSELRLHESALKGFDELEAGKKLYFKGRMLPSGDVFLVLASSDPLPRRPEKGSKSKKTAKLPVLPSSGKFEGEVLGHLVELKIFDVIVKPSRALHITYTLETH